MCGISGFYTFQGEQVLDPEATLVTLRKMASEICHRGPDENGFFVDSPAAFAHQRLSIIDLKTGHQPMSSSNNKTHIVFNGEIFNYIELRQQLISKGCQFRTQSDTEVILQLYEIYGEEFVSYLNGQFAFAIWDSINQKMILARDRIGICPLYFHRNKRAFYFASEIKSLLPVMDSPPTLSANSLDQLFTFWAPLTPNTIYDDIYEISPGEMLIIDQNTQETKRYWDFEFPENNQDFHQESEAELVNRLEALLIDATQIRLRSDVSVGAYLSGGLDSSLITSMIHHHNNNSLQTFSLGFTDQSLDESAHQATVVSKIQARHHSLSVSPQDIANNFVQTLWHTETPILRTAPVPMGLLSGLVRQHGVKVVLSGEGADEVLGGYDLFKEAKVRQFWARQPESEWRPLLLKKLYPYLKFPQGKTAAFMKRFFGEGLREPNTLWHSHMPRWTSTSKAKQFFSEHLKDQLTSNLLQNFEAQMPTNMKNWHWFNRAQYIESKSLMAGYLLSSQGDRMLTKNSIEGRFPFLDHRVIEFANRLPPKLKMKALDEKYLLKKVAEKYVPESIIKRHKQPYRAPDVLALTTPEMPSYAKQLLGKGSIRNNGYFDDNKTALLLKKAESGRLTSTADSQALVGILSTQIIHELFINKTNPKDLTT